MNYPGDAAFEKVLKNAYLEITVPQLRAFIMGCVLSEEFVSPNTAMEMILNSGKTKKEPFKNQTEAIAFMGPFMGLWNMMAEYQFSKTPYRFSELPKKFASDDEFKKVMSARLTEMCAFLDGYLQHGGEEGYELDPDDLDSISLSGAIDISVQAIAEQFEKFGKSKNAMSQSTILTLVDIADARIEKALKLHLNDRGKGPEKGASNPKPKKSAH